MGCRAKLVLEDGTVFTGERFGAERDIAGEVVFNTSMMGYQEILGDPSYAQQMVVMTYPMIGNYGIVPEDFESPKSYLTAMLVKECSRMASNWRHRMSLQQYLKEVGVVGLSGFDTRALVRHLRTAGAMRGYIGSADETDESLRAKALSSPEMAGCDLAKVVSTRESYAWTRGSDVLAAAPGGLRVTSSSTFRVVAYDFGLKRNILRRLVDVGCQVTVVPADTTAEVVLAMKPDGVFLSNGPGDPEPVTYAVANIKKLIGKVPIFGICLGHQLLAIACGAKSYKLKFGHRGGNHPVMELSTRKVNITAQNHGFAIDPATLDPAVAYVTHVNLNDHTVAGIRLKNAPAFGIQYHPEAAPGPQDAGHLFERFAIMMREGVAGYATSK